MQSTGQGSQALVAARAELGDDDHVDAVVEDGAELRRAVADARVAVDADRHVDRHGGFFHFGLRSRASRRSGRVDAGISQAYGVDPPLRPLRLGDGRPRRPLDEERGRRSPPRRRSGRRSTAPSTRSTAARRPRTAPSRLGAAASSAVTCHRRRLAEQHDHAELGVVRVALVQPVRHAGLGAPDGARSADLEVGERDPCRRSSTGEQRRARGPSGADLVGPLRGVALARPCGWCR